MTNTLNIMVGIPGCGKTTYVNNNRSVNDIVLSSDLLRMEIYGYETQEHNTEIFAEMNRRTKEAGIKNQTVWYDATNLNRKKRQCLYVDMKKYFTYIKIITAICPIDELIQRNKVREERQLPYDVLIRMIKTIQTPIPYESNAIFEYIYTGTQEYENIDYISEYIDYNQNNIHHNETLGLHIERVADACKLNTNAYVAALYHDVGKPFCRQETENGNCHYINHNLVSAYIYMCDVLNNKVIIEKSNIDIIALIEFHDNIFNFDTFNDMKKSIQKRYFGFDDDFWVSLQLLIQSDRLRKKERKVYDMFNIYYVYAGWMPISFGKRKDYPEYTYSKQDDTFFLSYLDYAKDELDNLFNLNEGNKKSYTFDLEGDELLLETNLIGDTLNIAGKYLYNDDLEKYNYSFDYKTFLVEYIQEWNEYKNEYEKNFAYDFEDYKWENDNWISLVNKIN